MRRLPWWGAVLLVAGLTGLLYLPITGIVWPGEGRAFSGEGRGVWKLPVRPGQEWVQLYFLQSNEADGRVTVDEITPIRARGIPDVVEIVDMKIAPRLPGRPALVPTVFWTDPDTKLSDCPNQPIVDLHGYEIPPGGHVMLAVRYRSLKPGTAAVGDFRIEYREGNLRRRTKAGIGQVYKVRDDAPRSRPDLWSRLCHKAGGSMILHETDYWE